MNAERWRIALLTGLGLGYLRPAPGTWGSLPPVVIALLLAWSLGEWCSPSTMLLSVNVALALLGAAAAAVCLKFSAAGETHFRSKDPGQVVADEVAGQSITLLLLPWHSAAQTPQAWKWNLAIAITGFLAFRLMDILKPPPARGLQRIPGGLGILIDDLIAGVYALILSQITARLIWPPVFS